MSLKGTGYLNQKARASLAWSEKEVPSRFDSEAFAGGADSELWLKMVRQEDQTLRDERSRETRLDWTPRSKSGKEVWHHNRTLEIPIIGPSGNPVGFCAIAEDFEFVDFPQTFARLGRMYIHEYNNLCAFAQYFADSARRTFVTDPDHAAKCLQLLVLRLITSARETEALYGALRYVDPEHYGPMSELERELKEIYASPPFNFQLSIDTNSSVRSIEKPDTIKGLIVALVNNAYKHSEEKGAIDTVIKVNAVMDGPHMVWEVHNRCARLKGVLAFRQTHSAHDSESSKRYGGLIMGDIIERAFTMRKAEEMISFPAEPVDGWVIVKLRCKTKEQ